MIKFEKVSFGQFKEAYKNLNAELTDEDIQWMYNDLQLPKRGTKSSAGYDFRAPLNIFVC